MMMENYNDTYRHYSAYLFYLMYWISMGGQDKAHFTFLFSNSAVANLAAFRRVIAVYGDFLSAVM